MILGTLPSIGHALNLTLEWDIFFTSKYDYAAGIYDSTFESFSGPGSITFENTVTSVRDYGTTTITNFGGLYDTAWSSPITKFIGTDSYGAGIGSGTSYTFPNVSDYPATFYEEAASQANVYSRSPDGGRFWAYHIELRAKRYSPLKGGTGTADYAFTPETLIAYYKDFATSGEHAGFNESYQHYDQNNSTSLGGYSWDGYAVITNIIDHSAPGPTDDPIPEPATLLLLGSGLVGLAVFGRKKLKSSDA